MSTLVPEALLCKVISTNVLASIALPGACVYGGRAISAYFSTITPQDGAKDASPPSNEINRGLGVAAWRNNCWRTLESLPVGFYSRTMKSSMCNDTRKYYERTLVDARPSAVGNVAVMTTRMYSNVGLGERKQSTLTASEAESVDGRAARHLGVLDMFNMGKLRTKGVMRKLALRQINRKIVARLARRATIAIPFVGFYFVSRLILKDYARVKAEYASGSHVAAGFFSVALACDLLDWAAQATVIAGLAHNNFGAGLAVAASLLAVADKLSLASAGLSCVCGVSGEVSSAAEAERKLIVEGKHL